MLLSQVLSAFNVSTLFNYLIKVSIRSMCFPIDILQGINVLYHRTREHSINLLWPLCCFSLQIYWYRQGDVDPKFKKMIYFNSFTTVLLCVCANIYFHFRDDCSWQKWNSFRCLLCRFRMAGFVGKKKIQRKMLASASFTIIYPISHLKGTLFTCGHLYVGRKIFCKDYIN